MGKFAWVVPHIVQPWLFFQLHSQGLYANEMAYNGVMSSLQTKGSVVCLDWTEVASRSPTSRRPNGGSSGIPAAALWQHVGSHPAELHSLFKKQPYMSPFHTRLCTVAFNRPGSCSFYTLEYVTFFYLSHLPLIVVPSLLCIFRILEIKSTSVIFFTAVLL